MAADPAADVSGFTKIKFTPEEALLWASVYRRNNLPKLFVQMTVQSVDENWAFNLEKGYPFRVNTKDFPITWSGFFYPKTDWVLVIETGRLTSTWDTNQFRYHFQSAIVVKE